MFRRPFAYQAYGGGDWEDWTPPWERPGRPHGPHFRGPRFFARRMRRGFFGPGGPFGGEDPRGDPRWGPARRFFGRGDVKYAVLELLQERPMHGYEVMRALEERSGGFYAPSAGTIYPTLQMLEDRGWISSSEVEGKKIYSITEDGKAALGERQKAESEFTPPWERLREQARRWNAPELQALRSEAMEVARLFTIAGRTSFDNPERTAHLRSIIERTRKELSEMIYGSQQQQQPPQTGSSPDVEQV
jgi:DNA-binding PadR family transcriptional regulator